MSKDTLDIKELLNKVGWIAFLAGKTSPDDENKDNYYKQSEISIKRAEQAFNLYIEERVKEARNKVLDDLMEFRDEVLESRGIPNPTYVGKKELAEWAENYRSTPPKAELRGDV